MWHGSSEEASIAVPSQLPDAMHALGLDKAVGYLWTVPQSVCTLPTAGKTVDVIYVPYKVSLGVPIYNRALCAMVRRFHSSASTWHSRAGILVSLCPGCDCTVLRL
jgi:hypothetical protein